MSRSVAKTKAIKAGGRRQSDKKDKIAANKHFRRLSKVRLHTGEEEKLPMNQKETADNWDFSSDGRAVFWPDLDNKYMRK